MTDNNSDKTSGKPVELEEAEIEQVSGGRAATGDLRGDSIYARRNIKFE